MVALKHQVHHLGFLWLDGKQERRGGIETMPLSPRLRWAQSRSRNAVVALKQGWRPSCLRLLGSEAGTPWWH